MASLPSFAKLKAEYPDYVNYTSAQVLNNIGGKVKINAFANTCAVRLSRTLNYNSLELPGPSKFPGGAVVSGDDKKWYAFRVPDIRKWLTIKLSKPGFDLTKKAGEAFDKTTICTLKGIIGFDIKFNDATGHLDLWDGSFFTSERKGGLTVDYWESATRIWVWTAV
jgi:hypothetical protein